MAVPAGFNHQQTRPSSGLIPLWWVLAPGVLGAAILGAFVLYASLNPYSPSTKPATPPTAAGGLPWGDTVLWNTHQVKSWLHAHGAGYRRWKRRHPAAYAIVRPKKHHAPAVKHKHAGRTKRNRAP